MGSEAKKTYHGLELILALLRQMLKEGPGQVRLVDRRHNVSALIVPAAIPRENLQPEAPPAIDGGRRDAELLLQLREAPR